MLPPSTRAARAILAFGADSALALGAGSAAAAAQAAAGRALSTRRRKVAAGAGAAAALFALAALAISGPAPTLPPRAGLPGPYIIPTSSLSPTTPPPPLPRLGFAVAPRPSHSDDLALASLAAPARAARFWGGREEPVAFILNTTHGDGEAVGVRVVRAAVLARREHAAPPPSPAAWLAAPPAVVWLPPGVARALAAAATKPTNNGSSSTVLLADPRLGLAGGAIFTDAALDRLDGEAGRAGWAACLGSGQGPEACLKVAGLSLLDARTGREAASPGANDTATTTTPQPGDGGVPQLLADALLSAAGACGAGSRCGAAVDRTAGAVLVRPGVEEPPVPGLSPIEAAAPLLAAPSAAAAARLAVAAVAAPDAALAPGGAGGTPLDAALQAAAARVRGAVAAHCPAIDALPPPQEEEDEKEEGEGEGEGAAVARAAAASAAEAADLVSARSGGACVYAGFEARRAVGQAAADAVEELMRAVLAATG